MLDSEANETKTSSGFLTQQTTLSESNVSAYGIRQGWWALIIQVLSSTIYSPFNPYTCRDVEVCKDTVAPVEIPVIYSIYLRRKELPDRGKVLKAIFVGNFYPSQNLKSPSKIQAFSAIRASSLLFNIVIKLLKLIERAVVHTTEPSLAHLYYMPNFSRKNSE